MNEFTFEQLNPLLHESLSKMGVTVPSEVQSLCIPHALNGEDLFIKASTGAGKTFAFLIPVIEKLEMQKGSKHFPQALILCPTRELAQQIAYNCRKLLANREGIRTALLTGGVDMQAQIRAFSKGADIVVGTPARVLDHLRRHTFKPRMCETVILDEADVMLSMGFEEDVRSCLEQIPAFQKMLFSATYDDERIVNLGREILRNPFMAEVENHDQLEQEIRKECVVIPENRKVDYLKTLLKRSNDQTIIFCNKKVTADFIAKVAEENGYSVSCVHSDTNPRDRKIAMARFRSAESRILCATDAVSRGIDIPDASLVISFDLPDQNDTLVHRFGRTARGGNTGTAYVLVLPSELRRTAELKEAWPDLNVRNAGPSTANHRDHADSQRKSSERSKNRNNRPDGRSAGKKDRKESGNKTAGSRRSKQGKKTFR